jgi:hypothetical protein
MQNSEFKTGASLSSISVAFHGEVIVENWEKKSLDYRQYIHMLPREGVSKRLWEPALWKNRAAWCNWHNAPQCAEAWSLSIGHSSYHGSWSQADDWWPSGDFAQIGDHCQNHKQSQHQIVPFETGACLPKLALAKRPITLAALLVEHQ